MKQSELNRRFQQRLKGCRINQDVTGQHHQQQPLLWRSPYSILLRDTKIYSNLRVDIAFNMTVFCSFLSSFNSRLFNALNRLTRNLADSRHCRQIQQQQFATCTCRPSTFLIQPFQLVAYQFDDGQISKRLINAATANIKTIWHFENVHSQRNPNSVIYHHLS